MAKKTKSTPTTSSREVAPGANIRLSASDDSRRAQPLAASASTPREPIEDTDRAASAIPDSVRAENDARDRIAARAYELFLQRGGDHGRDTDDWLEAEREVGSRSDRPNDE